MFVYGFLRVSSGRYLHVRSDTVFTTQFLQNLISNDLTGNNNSGVRSGCSLRAGPILNLQCSEKLVV